MDRASEWRELPVWFFTTCTIVFFSAIYTLSQHLNTTAHKEKKDRRIIFSSESTSPSYLRWRTPHWARRQWQRRRFRCSPRGRGRRGYWSWGRASPSLWPAAGLRAPDAATSVMTRRTQRGTWLLKNKRKGCNKKKKLIQNNSYGYQDVNCDTCERRKSCSSCSWCDSVTTRPSLCTTRICSTPMFSCSWMDLNT